MKVILLRDVPKVGTRGEVVEVADGYARNYLIPRKLASPATRGQLTRLEKERADAARRRERELEQARRLARRLQGAPLVVKARAGEGGKLFGSVTSQDVARALAEAQGVEVDRRKIRMDPLRSLGEHRAEIRLHPQVTTEVRVLVEPEA